VVGSPDVCVVGDRRLSLEALATALNAVAGAHAIWCEHPDPRISPGRWLIQGGPGVVGRLLEVSELGGDAAAIHVLDVPDHAGVDATAGVRRIAADTALEALVKQLDGALGPPGAPDPAGRWGNAEGCRVVIGHRWRTVGDALQVVLSRAGVDVLASVATGPEVLAASADFRPEVVLVEHALIRSRDLADTVRGEHGSRVLVLGATVEQTELLDALESGADGFLSPCQPLGTVLKAIGDVHLGDTYIPPGMLSGLLRELITRRRDEDVVLRRFGRLSRRERTVLRLIAEGATAQEMASSLVLSPHTVRTHVQNVLEKLEVHSRVQAASMVLEYDLLSRFPDEP